MATKLDDTQRPLYVDSVALKALINRIGVLRESLREEMKHLNVEVDSSKFITKELFDAHIEDYNQFKLSTTTKLTEITEILSRMVSPGDVEEAYIEATAPPTPYELRTYDVYELPTSEYPTLPATTDEMMAAIEGRESMEQKLLFKDGAPYALEGFYNTPDESSDIRYLILNFPKIYSDNDIFVVTRQPNGEGYYGNFYIYKLKRITPNVNVDDYVILDDTQMA